MEPPATAARLARRLALVQHDWLQGARARLLRRADIARRRDVLELGAGWGATSVELQRRCAGHVVAVDLEPGPVGPPEGDAPSVRWLAADAAQLPLGDGCFDLVFTQFALLWMREPGKAVAEAFRVLRPGGALAAIEPDYGGLMEYPASTAVQSVWLAALRRAGAEPEIGRRLPDLFHQAGFQVETRFPDRLEAADPRRFEFLRDLPLTDAERDQVRQAQAAVARLSAPAVAHLPLWLVHGERPAA